MHTLFQSVRWRLQLWHALILLAVITVLCMLAYRLAANEKLDRIDRDLDQFEFNFIRILRTLSPDYQEDTPPSIEEHRRLFLEKKSASQFPLEMQGLFDENSKETTYLAFWDTDGSLLYRSANAPANLSLGDGNTDRKWRQIDQNHHRQRVRGGPRRFRHIVGRDISNDIAALHRLAFQIGLSGAALWLIGLVGGWWLAGRAIQPINDISRTASRIAGGNVSERINLANTDNELGRLSQVLNETFDRLESAIARQRQFTADASHELRTPLTVILSETTRALKRDRSREEYREIVETCGYAATRMRSLVEALLTLAHQDEVAALGNRQEVSPTERIELSLLILDSIKLLQPLADQRQTAIRHQLSPLAVEGVPRSLSMLVTNLLANAIDHQTPCGQVTVRLFGQDQQAILEIIDQGPGIAAEHLPHLFDRFYRIDPARGPASGHSGLGLAIAKAIVENHHGAIEVESTPGTGSTFRVTLPLSKTDEVPG